MEKSDTEQPASGATRALVSAGIFGALGALFGRWLGHRGNAPESNMAKPMMTWSMGAFWAFLAAYSALKSSEAEKLPPVPEGASAAASPLGVAAGLERLLAQRAPDGSGKENWTADRLAQDNDAREAVTQLLVQHGIEALPEKTLGGSMSLVLELPGKAQVLRIVDAAQEPSSAGHKGMLQPLLDMGETHGFRVQLFPKVTLLSEALANGSIGKAEALRQTLALEAQFAAQGKFFWDIRVQNLCVVGGNQVQLLDPGSVCAMSERHGGKMGHDTHSYEDKYRQNIQYLHQLLGEAPALTVAGPGREHAGALAQAPVLQHA